MQKLTSSIVLTLALVFTFLFSSCGNNDAVDFRSQIEAQLILAQGDLSIYYENYASKASATADMVFKMIIPPIKRPGWQETLAFFSEVVPKAKGEQSELCHRAHDFYTEIDRLDYANARRGDFEKYLSTPVPFPAVLIPTLGLGLAGRCAAFGRYSGEPPSGKQRRRGQHNRSDYCGQPLEWRARAGHY